MGKILKIEDVKITKEDGVQIAKYIFNDDKIVRINNKTDRVITKNVPQKYLDLISIHSASAGTSRDDDDEEEKARMIGEIPQEGSITGWLLVWVIATIALLIFLCFSLSGDSTNPLTWAVTIATLASLIMVLCGKGARWFIIAEKMVFGVLFLYGTIALANSPYATLGYGLRGGLSPYVSETALNQFIQMTITIEAIITIYMFASGFYFLASKRVHARFGK